MQKKIFVMAAIAVLCSAMPAFSAGTCENWKGVWDFTYDDNMTIDICFDNTTLTGDNFTLCDNDSLPNCQCLDNITSKEICFDNDTFEYEAVEDNTSVCVANPFYIESSVVKGTQQVIITETQDNVSTGITLSCLATGTREDGKPIMIAQVTGKTANLPLYKAFDIDNDSYVYYESMFAADTATKPFSQIFADNYTGTAFTAREEYNALGLVSGTRTGDLCALTIYPKTIRQLIKFFNPITPFLIIADRDNEFELTRPVTIDWGTDNIITVLKMAVTKKIILGFAFVRPFKIETEELFVTVTNADNDTCYGTVNLKALGGN